MPHASVLPDLDSLRTRIAKLQADTMRADTGQADTMQAGTMQADTGSGDPARRDGCRATMVPLGAADLDALLGGGLKRGALHEVRAQDADGPLAFGFALALLARLSLDGPVHRPALIVTTFDGAGEWGRPYGPGLAAFGLDPARLLMVETRRPRDALWAAEEGLASRALAVVVAEIRGDPAVVDLTATRRLALRAARSGVTALLVRPGTGEGLSAARTRWRVRHPGEQTPTSVSPKIATPNPAAPNPATLPFALPPPAWRADLERNATKPGGRFCLMWNPDERIFANATPDPLAGTASPEPALPRPAAAPPSDRTAAAGQGRTEDGASALPFRRAG